MKQSKVIFASVFGNMLEFYDFTLFGFFSLTISQAYFPAGDAATGLLQSLAVFGAGFLMRPFGAVLFGYIGDKYGRKQALTLSVLLMGIPTLAMGLMPSYAQIGLLAPIVIMVCRLVQGLCTGGEYNGAAIFALEHVGAKGAGLTGGIICGSAGLGALAALGINALVTLEGMPEWGWRAAFIFGATCSFAGWYVRVRMSESPVFKTLQKKGEVIESSPFLEVMRSQKLPVLTTLVIGVLDGVLAYFVFIFLALFIEKKLGYSHGVASMFGFIGIIGFTLGSPLMGWVLDRSSRKGYFKVCMLVLTVLSFPAFVLLETQSYLVLGFAVLVFSLMAAAVAGAQHAYVQNLFPAKDRYSGIAFSFSTGVSIGGFSPFIFGVFMNKPNGVFYMGFYLTVWALIGLFVVLKMNKRLSKKI